MGLEQPGIHEWVTGKFVLEVVEGEDKNQRLSIVVELLPGASGGEPRARAAAGAIEAELLRLNSEFKSYVPEGRRTPEVRLVAAGGPAYFPVGVKHRYTRK